MNRSSFFLRTKLLPPRAGSELLERPRLIERLQTNLSNPLTLVAADAGSGKTTLIADFVRRQSREAIWYQLDHTDADPAVFLGYVAHGIRNIVSDFGDAIFPYLSEAGEDILIHPERAADLLLNELLRSVEEPFILVLDDYHHIGRDTVVHKIVDRLVQYSSDLLHLVITTRDLPPLAIMRRKAQSSALIITRDDLLFTDDEVRSLFQKTLKVNLKDTEVADYRARTNGWITALQLVRQLAEQKLHSGSPVDKLDLGDVLRQSERDISDYFAEEVFSREMRDVQDLLLRLSLFEALDLDTCGQLFPDLRCSAMLPELAQKNMFLTVAGDGKAEEYRLHPLFRDFLRRRLRAEIGRAAVAAEQLRIAEHFILKKQWETALPYLLEGDDHVRAAEIIAETGTEWIAAGAYTSLRLFTERILEASLEEFPRSLLYRAEVLRLHGEIGEAQKTLKRAVELLHKKGDRAGEAECLHSLASIARRKGEFTEAFALLEKATKLAATDSETYIKCANTRGLCLVVQGKWVEAEKQFRIALDAAERQGNERYIRLATHNLALAPGFRGDFGEALRWFKRIFREGKAERQLPQEAIGHLNVARLHLYRGEFDDTEKHLERALELCQLYNMRLLRGEIFEAYGNLHREKKDVARAEEYYERAVNAYEEAEVDISTKELDEERAAFYMMRGELATARTLLEKLIEAKDRQGNQSGVNTAKLRLLQIDLAEKKTDGVVDQVEKIVEYFREQGQYYYEAVASMLLAEALFATGHVRDVVEPVRRALDLSARFDYDYWLRSEIRRNADIFNIEEIAERLPGDLKRELGTAAAAQTVPVAASESIAAQSLTDLTIRLLGHPEIFRDPNKPFAPDAWTTRRARDILFYIAASKQRRVAKDVLIDAFWPDDDPAVIEKNFHPTISHIRKALNSRQSLKQNFIVFREGSYQLNPELSYSIDTEEFERHIADAEAAKRAKDNEAFRRALESAYSVYRDEFMSGVYEEWAEERRTFYSEQFMRVLSGLAKLEFAEKRWANALKYAQEVLAVDPFREDMHRLIMKVLAAQSKRIAVKKQFEGLKTLLSGELGIEPAPETRRLYQELMHETPSAVER
jgi:LuxR family maltose regulon positive regulatory protein